MGRRPKFRKELRESTGIYQEELTIPETEAAMKAAAIEMAAQSGVRFKIAQISAAVAAVYERHGLPCNTKTRLPESAAPILKNARELLFQLRALKRFLESGDIEAAADCAMLVGSEFEKLRVRPSEPLVLIGKKVRLGGKKGHEKEHGDDAKKQKERAERLQVYEKYFNAGLPRSKAYEAAAKELGVSSRTIADTVRARSMQKKKQK